MTVLDLTIARSGETLEGDEISYYPLESMALPAELVLVSKDGFRETVRYDSRLYALAVFAQETDDKTLLTAVQDAELESCECANCEEVN